MSPSQGREIDALSSQFPAEEEREMEEWANLVHAGPTGILSPTNSSRSAPGTFGLHPVDWRGPE